MSRVAQLRRNPRAGLAIAVLGAIAVALFPLFRRKLRSLP